jgi:hypothetical protein
MPTPVVLLDIPGHKIEVEAGPRPVLRISGMMDENMELGQLRATLLPRLAGAKTLHVDLAGVVRMNSQGTVGWHVLLESLQKALEVRFLAISEAVVEQAMLIPTVLGRSGTVVEKFAVPYLCPKCRSRTIIDLARADVTGPGDKHVAPARKCAKCATTMDFDGMQSDYFDFLRTH